MRAELLAVIEPLLKSQSPPAGAIGHAMRALMEGTCSDLEIASFLTALAIRGEEEQGLAEAATVMREHALRVPVTRRGLLDTCGTGGDKLRTFNISTAAAIIAAAAGAPVAKHGNRHASSSSGSADVLEALGVNISLTAEQAGRCIEEVGIGFCFARLLHPAMKHVAAVRSALGFRTIFNLLGPLSNPAGAEFQLLGASRIEIARRLAGAVSRLGGQRTLVVCGNDQLDEVALWGPTTVFDVRGSQIQQLTWTPDDFGLGPATAEQLEASSPTDSARIIRSILNGEKGPRRDMAVANAAAALLAASRVQSIREGVALAHQVIDSGAARTKLNDLANWTQAYRESSASAG